MSDTLLILGAFVSGLIVGFVLHLWATGKSRAVELTTQIEERLNSIIPKLTQAAGEQTALLAKEKLESTSQNLKDDFENKRELIGETIKRLADELERSNAKLERAERDRIGSFKSLETQIVEQANLTKRLSDTTHNLQRVLSNNQTRGQFGEQVAEDLLKMNGFVKGTDYLIQEAQADGARPDFTVLLPNGMKINIDSKFPYQNLLRIVDATEETQKAQYRKLFEQDVKEKIRQVTSRNYIDPEANTVDFVILFVPNEMIFSYIYDKMQDIWMTGMRQKVVFAGPFSFTAILRMVRQAYDYFSVQKNLRSIISHIQTFKEEFEKYNVEVDKLGDRVDSILKQYQVVSQTRTTKLLRIVDKIQLEDGIGDDPPALPIPVR